MCRIIRGAYRSISAFLQFLYALSLIRSNKIISDEKNEPILYNNEITIMWDRFPRWGDGEEGYARERARI